MVADAPEAPPLPALPVPALRPVLAAQPGLSVGASLMAPPRRYYGDSVPTAFRTSRQERRILEWLALSSGADSVSAYVRGVVEDHLAGLGFPVEPGVTAQLPLPSREQVAAWWMEETA